MTICRGSDARCRSRRLLRARAETTRKQGTDHRFVLYWYHSLAEDALSFIQLTKVNTLQFLYSSLSNSSDRKSNPVSVWDAPRVLAV